MVARLKLASLGPIGMLASAQATFRDAVAVLCRFTELPGQRMRVSISVEDGSASVRLRPKSSQCGRAAHAAELALGVALRVCQGLLGPDWRPRHTGFIAEKPVDVGPYEALFGDVSFGHAISIMTFDPADLDRPLATANKSLAKLVSHYLNELASPAPAPFEDEVRELVTALMPRGLCSIERVAQHLGVDRRTIHRRLAQRGASFTGLVFEIRRAIVEDELRAKGRPLAAVAAAAGLSDKSSFSRWFRHAYGVSPSEFRRRG